LVVRLLCGVYAGNAYVERQGTRCGLLETSS
jgi:hypothetical protein